MAGQPPKGNAPAPNFVPRGDEEHDRFIQSLGDLANSRPQISQAEQAQRQREEQDRLQKEQREQARFEQLNRFRPSVTGRGRANQRARGRGARGRGGASTRGAMVPNNPNPASTSHPDSNLAPTTDLNPNDMQCDVAMPTSETPAQETQTAPGQQLIAGPEATYTITPETATGAPAIQNQEYFKASLYDEEKNAEWNRQANMHMRSSKQKKKADKQADAAREARDPNNYTYRWDEPYDMRRPTKPGMYEGTWLHKQNKYMWNLRCSGQITKEEHHKVRALGYIQYVTHPKWGVLKDQPYLASPYDPFPESDPNYQAHGAQRATEGPSGQESEGASAGDSDPGRPSTEPRTPVEPAGDVARHDHASGDDAWAARAAMGGNTHDAYEPAPALDRTLGSTFNDHELNDRVESSADMLRPASGLGYAQQDSQASSSNKRTHDEEDDPTPYVPKKSKFNSQAFLEKSGFQEGKGLGKNLSGRIKYLNQVHDKAASKAAGRPIGRIHDADRTMRAEDDGESGPSPVVRLTNLLAGYTNVPDQQLNNDLFGKITNVLRKSCGRIERVKVKTEADGGKNEVYLKFVDPISALSAIQKDGSKQSELLTEDMMASDKEIDAEVRVAYFKEEAFEAGNLS